MSIVAGAMLIFSACDTLEQASQDDTGVGVTASSANSIVDGLQLSGAEAEIVKEAFARHADEGREASWYVAAELQETLSAEQKQALIEKSQARLEERKQQTEGMRGRRGTRRQGARDSLLSDLTDEQKEQLRAAREATGEKLKALVQERKAGNLSEEELRTQADAIRQSMRESLSGILTADQLEKLDARREKIEGERGERGRRAGAKRAQRRSSTRADGAASEAMIDALGLTTEQQEQLEALREEQRTEFEAAKKEIRDKVKSGNVDREAINVEMKERMEAAKAKTDAIFTEKQRQIIDIHRALRVELIASKMKARR